jgi:hypothetical protein
MRGWSKTMFELLQKKKKICIVYLIIIGIVVAGTVILAITISQGIIVASFFVLIVLLYLLVHSYVPLKKTSDYIISINADSFIEDVDFKKYTYPDSKLSCGKNAFYSAKDNVVLLYDQILWIYKSVQKVYFVSVYETWIFACRNNQSYSMHINEYDLKRLLQRIAQVNPSIFLGYSEEKRQQYKKIVEAGNPNTSSSYDMQENGKKVKSKLSIAALIFSFLSPAIGIILAIIDLNSKEKLFVRQHAQQVSGLY